LFPGRLPQVQYLHLRLLLEEGISEDCTRVDVRGGSPRAGPAAY
jgi:hypothetical protein